ncbi:MAG: ATP-dependent DNA helicase RecG [Chloroflexi bacterium]|nr:ATP-dependent DNA helicase RecG [Chloroflexota bacterium]
MSTTRSPRSPARQPAPSLAEVENARKIFEAERKQGCQDRVVVGGLAAFLGNWERRVHAASADPACHALARDVAEALVGYAEASPPERASRLDAALALLSETSSHGAPHPPAPSPACGREGERVRGTEVLPAAGERTSKEGPPVPSLDTPIEQVKGVKEKEARLLAKLGIHVFGDLLLHYPSRYQAYPPATEIAHLIMQPIASVVGIVQQVDISPSPRGGLHKIVATIADRTGRVTATWFRHGRFSPVQIGQRVALSGRLTAFGRALNFDNPDWERDDGDPTHTRRMVPTYPLTASLTDRALRERIKWAVAGWTDRLPDPLPGWVRETYDLWPYGEAVRQVHFPDDEATLALARRRLAFDELFTIQLVVLQRKLTWQGAESPPLPTPAGALATLLAAQPYELTGGQHRALDGILTDIAESRPMVRLLQGEVGSGKTAVAAAALFVAVQAGAQGSLMAPTEILAEQHYRSLTRFYAGAAEALEAADMRVPRIGLLTGSVKTAERRRIYAAIAESEIDVLVGTQAVIQEHVEFANLGLAVVDEQHRFGVRQRVALREKGGHPHLLVMTATPIPRTLALSLYGDLDLSLIDEMPPGRQKVKTYLLNQDERQLAYEKIRREVAKGGQAFVICPLVEDSPNLEARAATAEYERLQASDLAGLRLALLHGRMRPAEKDAMMRAFRDQAYDVLVSTAVVEVGVDIPNASVMLIEGAERFGLAQLHQFRGRVGRGARPSVCLLLTEEASDTALSRLQVLVDSDSGLALAEHDLRLRGPGDYFGVRQSGFPELQIATLDDAALVERARRAAEKVLEYDATLELPQHAALARRVEAFRRRSGEPN